ncbi:RpiB/LacA/LacB family sugar-phosphate isomerase [Candidatus Woesearchaeota archaeon]|nr:RpiB/LacA/LacB family sugar-phosphate isomerase [Candidatus Woesearchaeota archaeon]
MKAFLGADHGGFRLKERIKELLTGQKINFEDLGPYSHDPEDDYVDYAVKVAEMVRKTEGSFGILICKSGTGMALAANKIKGIRAAKCTDAYTARMARRDEDANVLALRSENTSPRLTKKIILTFLKTKPSDAKRHKRRLDKIKRLEKS